MCTDFKSFRLNASRETIVACLMVYIEITKNKAFTKEKNAPKSAIKSDNIQTSDRTFQYSRILCQSESNKRTSKRDSSVKLLNYNLSRDLI